MIFQGLSGLFDRLFRMLAVFGLFIIEGHELAIEAARRQLRKQDEIKTFDSRQHIEGVIEFLEPVASSQHVSLVTELTSGLLLYGDSVRLDQIVANLVANAIDACKEDCKISVRARTSKDFQAGCCGVRITVADNGIGMSAEDKRRLFTPFFTTKKAVGTGLGLWITKNLIEKRGGHIRFRSSNSNPSVP